METDEEFLNILKIRKYYDMGKEENKEIPNIEKFKKEIRDLYREYNNY